MPAFASSMLAIARINNLAEFEAAIAKAQRTQRCCCEMVRAGLSFMLTIKPFTNMAEGAMADHVDMRWTLRLPAPVDVCKHEAAAGDSLVHAWRVQETLPIHSKDLFERSTTVCASWSGKRRTHRRHASISPRAWCVCMYWAGVAHAHAAQHRGQRLMR